MMDGGKSSSGSNYTSNKAARSMNAVAKGSDKAGSASKTPAGKPASSGAKKNKMGGMDNGLCPVGKKLVDAPRCSVDSCKDRAHWGWCDKKGCPPCRMRHEVKAGQPGKPVGPKINKVRGRWTSHTKEDCRHKDKHKEWEN